MASRGAPITVQYVAWDNATNSGRAGDVANHTLRWAHDAVVAAPAATPVEVDAAAMPGVYAVALSAAETSTWFGTLGGVSSSSGVVLLPVAIAFELLPSAPLGGPNGLPRVDDLLTGDDFLDEPDIEAIVAEVLTQMGFTPTRVGRLDSIVTAPANWSSLVIVDGGASLNMTQAVPRRNQTAVTAPNLADCLASGHAAACGPETLPAVNGPTTWTRRFTDGAIFRTFTVNSGLAPTSRA